MDEVSDVVRVYVGEDALSKPVEALRLVLVGQAHHDDRDVARRCGIHCLADEGLGPTQGVRHARCQGDDIAQARGTRAHAFVGGRATPAACSSVRSHAAGARSLSLVVARRAGTGIL